MIDGNFLLLRPYHGEHGPKVPVTPEYIVLQRVLRKRECMSILTDGIANTGTHTFVEKNKTFPIDIHLHVHSHSMRHYLF
jgi:hypothetical protein